MQDLNQIAAFVEVVRQGSFVGAARQLEIPRSTVSARVQALESTLGVRLLKRTTRRMALTPEGRAYHDEVGAAVDTLRTAGANIGGDVLSGTVRLTAPLEYPLGVLSAAVRSFRESHPRVRIDVQLTNRTLDLAESGVDLAVRGGAPGGRGLVAIRLPDLPFGLFASPSYLRRRGTPKRLADLDSHELLLFRGRDRRRLLGLPKSLENASRRAETATSADSMTLLKQLAEDGGGIAVLPVHLASSQVESGALARVVPSFSGANVAASFLVFPSRRDIPARVRAFAEHLKAAAGRRTLPA